MVADVQDADFMQGMQQLLGMDEAAVEEVIEQLDSDTLSELSDALANNDRAQAQQIVASLDTNEEINNLFRGNLENEDQPTDKPQQQHGQTVGTTYGFKFGDDVQVPQIDVKTGKEKIDPKTGQVQYEDGTVYLPDGPSGTVGVKVQGKSRMVKHNKVQRLEEDGVLGMVGIPNVGRLQQLAGLQPAGAQPTEITVPNAETEDVVSSCAAQQAMQALDLVATLLPNVRLADLKTIRQRIVSLQTAMNESVTTDRIRKS